jgi:hypothetical protein
VIRPKGAKFLTPLARLFLLFSLFSLQSLSILDDPDIYGSDGKLSISELDEALTERVEELTEGRQNAVMTKPGAVKRFFIASVN